MLTGSRVIEIYPSSSTNGPTLSGGSSSIQLPSSEPENSFGKKATLLMPLSMRLRNKCSITLISTVKYTKNCWPFQFAKASKHNHRNSREETARRLLRLGFPKMEEPSRLPLLTTWAKILPRCSRSCSKMRRKKRSSSGKPVGALQLDQLVSWSCTTEMTRVLSFLPESPTCRSS